MRGKFRIVEKSGMALVLACSTLFGCAWMEPAGSGAIIPGRWNLERFGDGSVATLPGASAAPTLALDADGRAAGSTGCNRFNGGYAMIAPSSLSFGPLATTRRACPPELMSQERRFLQSLESTSGYRVSGVQLVLLDATGEALLFFTNAE